MTALQERSDAADYLAELRLLAGAGSLSAECTALSQTYRAARAQLLVTFDRNVAYGCAAERNLNTIDDQYDRAAGCFRRTRATR